MDEPNLGGRRAVVVMIAGRCDPGKEKDSERTSVWNSAMRL
jgi:hypothetical protein